MDIFRDCISEDWDPHYMSDDELGITWWIRVKSWFRGLWI